MNNMVEPTDELTEQEFSELEAQADAEGIDLDDFLDELDNEALYDPAPRRRHRRGRRSRRYDPMPRRHRRKGRRHSRRTYDPAPRRRGRRGGRRLRGIRRHRAKGMMGKLKKYAIPGAAAATFVAAYMSRAKQLNMGFFDAIKTDMANWNATDAVNRVKANPTPLVATIGIPLVKRYAGLGRGTLGLVLDIGTGIAAGLLAKQVLDPPIPGGAARQTGTPADTSQKSVRAGQAVDTPQLTAAQVGYNLHRSA